MESVADARYTAADGESGDMTASVSGFTEERGRVCSLLVGGYRDDQLRYVGEVKLGACGIHAAVVRAMLRWSGRARRSSISGGSTARSSSIRSSWRASRTKSGCAAGACGIQRTVGYASSLRE